ncbi:Protein kinase [Mycena kentingensis (nom. inval.)]|nr:Protein kinase [Mycena kentingensis (nom. inval.)]
MSLPPIPELICLAGAENPLSYELGGLHPVHLGDMFANGRYTIVRKLGHGGSSTIWLVSDAETRTYASLKIISASRSNTATELAVLQHLEATYDAAEDGSQHVPRMRDHFEHEGPNGRHLCIVGEVLGPSLSGAVAELFHEFWDNGCLPPAIAHRLCGQITLALAYLHKRGVAHGDLHPGNVLLRLPGPLTSIEDVYRLFGSSVPHKYAIQAGGPGSARAPSSPHRPEYILNGLSAYPNLLRLCLQQPNIKLCDFSESYIPTLPLPPRFGTPRAFRPPDALLAVPPHVTPELDIWALGVLFHSLLSGTALFRYSSHGRNRADDDELLTDITRKLGQFPEPVWSMWDPERRRRIFGDGAKPLRTSAKLLGSMEHVLRPAERASFEKLLRSMLRYDAEKRVKVSRVLGSRWFLDNCRPVMGPGERYEVEWLNKEFVKHFSE